MAGDAVRRSTALRGAFTCRVLQSCDRAAEQMSNWALCLHHGSLLLKLAPHLPETAKQGVVKQLRNHSVPSLSSKGKAVLPARLLHRTSAVIFQRTTAHAQALKVQAFLRCLHEQPEQKPRATHRSARGLGTVCRQKHSKPLVILANMTEVRTAVGS